MVKAFFFVWISVLLLYIMVFCYNENESESGVSMLNNNYKTIGVFVTRAHEEYQDLL